MRIAKNSKKVTQARYSEERRQKKRRDYRERVCPHVLSGQSAQRYAHLKKTSVINCGILCQELWR